MIKIADLHTDTVLEIQGGADLQAGNPQGHVDLMRLKQGGVGLQTMACFVSSALPRYRAFRTANELLDLCYLTCQKNDRYMQIVENTTEIEQVMAADKIALLLAVENGYALENDVHKLELLRRRKVRYLTVTHSANLDWALSSAQKQGKTTGLTAFGKKVIAAMNALDIIVDLSHVHERTFWEVIKISKKPVIASHSNAAAICPIPRNLSDDQIKAIADTGGMIGINFYPAFLYQDFNRLQAERYGDMFSQIDEMELKYMDDPVSKVRAGREFNQKLSKVMSDIVVSRTAIIDHIDYIVRLVGDDFVGFGSDMDGIPLLPQGMSGCADYPQIVNDLQSRGYKQSTIEKICFRNFLRLLQAA
jgi:membrane dipeptidase